MSNINQLQAQAIQYIGNVRESHQQLIRRYVKDYRAIVDEVEISMRDLENVKARLGDYKDENRLNNIFAPIRHRYISRSNELTTGFANDISDSCANVERQINSILPADPTPKPLFTPLNFESSDETDTEARFAAVSNMLNGASNALHELSRKSNITFIIAYAIIIACSLIGLVTGFRSAWAVRILGESFVVVWSILCAACWFGLSYLIVKKSYILKNIKKHVDSFIQSFTSQKENLITDFGSVLKQYVNETEKNRFTKLQDKIQNVSVPELSE